MDAIDTATTPTTGAGVWQVGPVNAQLNLTNGCNLACLHCHASSGPKLDGELSTRELKHVLDQLHGLGVMNLAIAGGEPFVRRDVLEVLEYACALPGWRVAVITNGMFFSNSDRVAELAVRCPGLIVNVSVDGSTPEHFGVLRRQARRPDADPTPMFTTVTAAVTDLVAAGVTTGVNFTLTARSLPDCLPTYRLATQELGASALVAIKFFPGGYGKPIADLLEIPWREWTAWFTGVTRDRLAGDLSGLQISVPAAWEFYLPLMHAGLDVNAAERAWGYRAPLREAAFAASTSIGDPAGIAELCVDADGAVYPSVLLGGIAEAACGNIREEDLARIWRNSPALARMRHLDVTGLAASCGTCPARTVCGGGSRARALSLTGALNGADRNCPLITDRRAAAKPSEQAGPLVSAQEDAVQSRMRVIGAGPDAARLFDTPDGTQIRVAGRIISCRPETGGHLQAFLETAEESGTDPLPLLSDPSRLAAELASAPLAGS